MLTETNPFVELDIFSKSITAGFLRKQTLEAGRESSNLWAKRAPGSGNIPLRADREVNGVTGVKDDVRGGGGIWPWKPF
jgi:hypothetical protein